MPTDTLSKLGGFQESLLHCCGGLVGNDDRLSQSCGRLSNEFEFMYHKPIYTMINGITLSRLRNSEFAQFASDVLEILPRNEPD